MRGKLREWTNVNRYMFKESGLEKMSMVFVKGCM
jgi:hypothetical protein